MKAKITLIIEEFKENTLNKNRHSERTIEILGRENNVSCKLNGFGNYKSLNMQESEKFIEFIELTVLQMVRELMY